MTLEQFFNAVYTPEVCLAETVEEHLKLMKSELNKIEDKL